MEDWKKITEFYEVSNKGRVRSVDRIKVNQLGIAYHYKGKVLKTADNGSGYQKIMGKCGLPSKYVHRLVAMAFIPNPDNKPCVNHIDNNPSNNCVENLEWCSMKENSEHMSRQGRNKRTSHWLSRLHKSQEKYCKGVIGTNIQTKEEIVFKSVNETEEKGFIPSCVSQCCNGIRNKHKGYTWRFKK